MKKSLLTFLSLFLFLSLNALEATEKSSSFLKGFFPKVQQSLSYSEQLEGLHYSTWTALKDLEKAHFLEATGKDAENRLVFVNLQAAIEQVLTQLLKDKELQDVFAYVHTPAPATPLCTEEELDTDLLAPSLREDTKRAYTVQTRAHTLREFLRSGGHLSVLFTEEGMKSRTDKQQSVFEKELVLHSDHLQALPLVRKELAADLVGASYLFITEGGEEFLFSIQASQANAPSDEQVWKMWLGPMSDDIMQERLSLIMDLVEESSETSA